MHKSVRKGITQAKFNSENTQLLSVELVVISIMAGYISSSWSVFLLTFIFLIAILQTTLGYILVFLLSLGWGVLVGGFIYIGGAIEAGIVLGILTFLISIGGHSAGLQYYRDLSD